MYKVLLGLFVLSNCLAVLIVFITSITTIVAKVRSKSTSDTVNYPDFFNAQLSCAKMSFWSGTAFAVLDWLLCYSQIIEAGNAYGYFQGFFLLFALIWGATELFLIIVQTILTFIKSGADRYNVKSGIKAAVFYAVIYFLLAFLIS